MVFFFGSEDDDFIHFSVSSLCIGGQSDGTLLK